MTKETTAHPMSGETRVVVKVAALIAVLLFFGFVWEGPPPTFLGR